MTITTKYNIGDTVSFLYENEVVHDKIKVIDIRPINETGKVHIYYELSTKRRVGKSADAFPVELKENLLFPTKADLLNSL